MKRKVTEKMLAVAMAASMVLSLAGCGDNAAESSNAGASESSAAQEADGEESADAAEEAVSEEASAEPEDDRPFAQYIKDEVPEDLNGYEFVIVDFGASRWYPGSSYPDVDTESFDPTKEEHVLKDMIIKDVEETFNCHIVIQAESPDGIVENAQPAIMAGDKYADVIGTTQQKCGPLIVANLLLDLNEVDSIDLSADYWNQSVIDFATLAGKTYGVGGGFAPDLGNSGVVFYNARIWEELDLPDPLELLENDEWTWANFLEYCKLATRDGDGDGQISSGADRYGLVGPVGGIEERMIGAMGENFIKKNDDGSLSLGLASDEAAEKLDFIYDFFQKENVVSFVEPRADFLDYFAAGDALFMIYGNTGSDKLREMEDDFGVLPMPKWDASQPYYYCQTDGNTPIFCMTNTNQNTHEAGVIFSALARRFQIFEDKLITDRVDSLFWRLDETETIMRDYVMPGRQYEIANLIKQSGSEDFGQITGKVVAATSDNEYSDISSEMKAFEEQINIALDEFMDGLN